MELILILRVLVRHRALVALSLLAALALGTVVAFRVSPWPPQLHSRQHLVGAASTNILVDTPQSTIADLTPSGADQLPTRTVLLANLLSSNQVTATIARIAGISPTELAVVPPASGTPLASSLLAQGVTSSVGASSPYQLSVMTFDGLSVISIQTQAPDALHAAKLANATVRALQQYLGSIAAQQNIAPRQRPVVTALGAARAGEVLRGTPHVYALVAALFTFVVLCALIVLVSGLRRGWRRAAAFDETAEPPSSPAVSTLDAHRPAELSSDVVAAPHIIVGDAADRVAAATVNGNGNAKSFWGLGRTR